jgi:SAM-dependent methyltransferase
MTTEVTEYYKGAAGAAYHEQRAAYRTDADQRLRSGYFADIAQPQGVLLDFGCATGGVAASLPARKRIGIEINETSAAEAKAKLDEVHRSLGEVADGSVDVAISFHAIEHVPSPLEALQEIYRVVKPGGTFRAIVPYESPILHKMHRKWFEGDVTQHLFSWTPLTFGNLIASAGFNVQDARVAPFTGGGRMGKFLAPIPPLSRAWFWLKSIKGGRMNLVVTSTR